MNIYKHNRLPALGRNAEREVVDEFRRVERWATRVNGYLSEDIMKWAGSWGGYGTSYVKGDVVSNGEWTMVANKETTEYPFPQAATDIAWAVFGDTTPTWVAQSTSTTRLLTGIRIVPDYVAVVHALRVWIPLIDPDVGYYIFSQVEGQVPHYEQIFPTEIGWFPITFSSRSLSIGVPVEIYLVTQGQGTTSTTFTHKWNYRLSSAILNPDNPPVVGQFRYFSVNAPDIAYLNKTDSDGVARKGDLDTLQAGDTIAWTDSGGVDVFYTLTADPTYYNSAVGEEDFYELNLSPAVGQGSNGAVEMTFTHFLDRPTSYVQITDRFSGVAGVKGLLSTTGNVDDVVETNDAYGIDVLYQEVSFPVDWDVVAYSGAAGGAGGGTEEPTIPDHNALNGLNVLASGHTADVLNYDNTSSGLAANTVQAAIDEVAGGGGGGGSAGWGGWYIDNAIHNVPNNGFNMTIPDGPDVWAPVDPSSGEYSFMPGTTGVQISAGGYITIVPSSVPNRVTIHAKITLDNRGDPAVDENTVVKMRFVYGPAGNVNTPIAGVDRSSFIATGSTLKWWMPLTLSGFHASPPVNTRYRVELAQTGFVEDNITIRNMTFWLEYS